MRRGYLEEGSDAAGGDGVARVQKPPHTVVARGRILYSMYTVNHSTSRKIWEFRTSAGQFAPRRSLSHRPTVASFRVERTAPPAE